MSTVSPGLFENLPCHSYKPEPLWGKLPAEEEHMRRENEVHSIFQDLRIYLSLKIETEKQGA